MLCSSWLSSGGAPKQCSSCTEAEPRVLQELRGWQLEDIDCDFVRGSVVDWLSLRSLASSFDETWRLRTAPPTQLCPARTELRSAAGGIRSTGQLAARQHDWDGEVGFNSGRAGHDLQFGLRGWGRRWID
ncbi:unnamed protein product [Polarella glacialis]|uniref:Uncharacterized protein n=1 Tax=Polarella glacialis TaxID=89957 RepID=A0A813KPI3_POLGL|nr:unnamed protein product [Polarella glacialis]